MRAILSDLEALQAVLADAADAGAEQTICLGDTVGYGPNPIECLRIATSWPVVLQGNFDVAALSNNDLSGWSAIYAARSVLWTRRLLGQVHDGPHLRSFLTERPQVYFDDDMLFVHATPRNPLYEYMWPEDVANRAKIARIAEGFSRYCFKGHNHIPGLFLEEDPEGWRYVTAEECPHGFRPGGRKLICDVGSVGQPRDGDWRACYVLFDEEEIRFRRVEYDVDATVQKIHANPELNDFLGDRLREGR